MKLIVKCRACSEEIKVQSFATDRVSLIQDKGTHFSQQCLECLKEGTFHVNDVKATEVKFIKVIALAISVFGTAVVGYYMWGVLAKPKNPFISFAICFVIAFPSLVAYTLIKHQKDNIRRFNNYRG